MHTGKEIMANKSDIIITDHINNTCHLIDTKIPSDRNVSIMEVGKFSKHEDLEIKVNKMLKMEATTLPLAMCVLGVRKIGMRSAAEKRPGTINIEELQKNRTDGHCSHPQASHVNCLMRPFYPKSYGLDLDLQKDNPRIKRHIETTIIITIIVEFQLLPFDLVILQ